MTPPAATAAGRALPRTVAPRTARRVSGPARPKRDPRAGAPRTAAPRRGTTTRRPAAGEPLAVRALLRGQAMADSRFLQRLIGGRLWIPIVAGALIGIVFMQVSMLRMNAGISQTVDRASALERDNASLRADVSRLESGERIDRVASQSGMVVPGDSGQYYVRAGSRDPARAAIRMTSPDATAVARTQAAAAAGAATTTATTGAASTTGAAGTALASAPATTTTAPATTTTSSTSGAAGTATVTPAAQTAPESQVAAAPPAPAATGSPTSTSTTAPAQQGTATTAASGGTVAPTSGQG